MSRISTFSDDLFAGKSVLVTGAGTGIGAGIAESFAAHGARVAVHDITEENAQETVAKVRNAGGSASAFGGDLAQHGVAQSLFESAVGEFGTLDLLVNNAGRSWNIDTEGTEPEGAARLVELDLMSVLWLSRGLILHLKERGAEGAIVQIASTTGIEGYSHRAVYCAAKAGVIGLARALALDHGRDGVRVNCISPFVIETPKVKLGRGVATTNELDSWLAAIPLGRIGTPADVAGLALFLCSPAAAYLTGGNYVIDGGGRAGFYQA